jgi:hypothetical protein
MTSSTSTTALARLNDKDSGNNDDNSGDNDLLFFTNMQNEIRD